MKERYNPKDNPATSLVNQRTRKKIFHSVLITHAVIILTILLWGLALEIFKPAPPKSITVSLYTPPQASGVPLAYQAPKAKKKAAKKSRKTVKKTPKKRRKKPRKKWKPAKKIKISRKLVYVKPKKVVTRVQTIDKQKFLTSIKRKSVQIRSNNNNRAFAQSYENSVGAYLYQLWNTPDKSILGGRHPEVKILLNIAANGKLLNSAILQKSGISAMDKSVDELLSKLKYLPAPSNGAQKITLILEVID